MEKPYKQTITPILAGKFKWHYTYALTAKMSQRKKNIIFHIYLKKIVAAFRGMHVSAAKHSYGSVTDGQTDRRDGQTMDKVIPMCRYASQATQ